MKKLVYGVGINDADYVVEIKETIGYVDGKQKQKQLWICPFYRVWRDMLQRGHSEKLKLKYPTYKDVSVSKEWHRFSTFSRWMQTQDWQDKQLDKDLLIVGNKVYSPETCVFVSKLVNSFVTDSISKRGEYKIGVDWHKRDRRYRASCHNPFNLKQEHLGYFTNEEDAHEVWLSKKLEHARKLAAMQSDDCVAKALIDRYENYQTFSSVFE